MSKKLTLKVAVGCAASLVAWFTHANTARAYESNLHVFKVDDVMGGFDGSTFGPEGATQDSSIICGLEGGATCPEDVACIIDRDGDQLCPVDSEFGFYVVDFLGAQGKVRDGDYGEGFVGNLTSDGEVIGIKVSNAATDTYKVKPPLGTWCQGLGGTSVKCETEHYTTMEHVLTCHETVPYFFANPDTGEQAVLSTPDGTLTFDCANSPLNNETLILVDGAPTDRLTNSEPCEAVGDPEGCQMFPNDKTDTQNNIARSPDYSIQLKDDGKPLYGWGGLNKRPNDVRMYARLSLPDAWKEEGADFGVTKALLVVNHWITNNPNDQLRPEDLENEAATGRKPSYFVDGADEIWKSLVPCYEGDGDLIDTEEGSQDPTFLGVGTFLKNTPYAVEDPADPTQPGPYAFSSDLVGGFTNAFYTTINRDPFEWSYDANPDPLIQDFVGSPFPLPDEDLGDLVPISGPRWRLKANKFGQDLPGLEIPLIECSPPPFQSNNIKYVVGTPVTTVINLLDWNEEENGPSPLATSRGWVDVTQNDFVEIVGEVNGVPISSNGLPMTDDFDLAVYVKGDRKPTAVYNAQLIIEYEGEEPAPPMAFDLELTSLNVPARVLVGEVTDLSVTVTNISTAVSAAGDVTVLGISNRGDVAVFNATVPPLDGGETIVVPVPTEPWTWPAPGDKPTTFNWSAVVDAEGDTNPSNDSATGRTKVRKN
jgi:hypothetical protein